MTRIPGTAPPPPLLPLPCKRFHPIKGAKTAWKVRVARLRIRDPKLTHILTGGHRPNTHLLTGNNRCQKARLAKAAQWPE